MTISGFKGSVGEIVSVSRSMLRMLGYTSKSQLLGQNISIIIPSPIREVHNGKLIQFRGKAGSSMIGRTRMLFITRRSGELMPVWSTMAEAPPDETTGEPRLTSVYSEISSSQDFLLFSGPELDFALYGGSRGAFELLGMDPQAATRDRPSLRPWFPTLSESFDVQDFHLQDGHVRWVERALSRGDISVEEARSLGVTSRSRSTGGTRYSSQARRGGHLVAVHPLLRLTQATGLVPVSDADTDDVGGGPAVTYGSGGSDTGDAHQDGEVGGVSFAQGAAMRGSRSSHDNVDASSRVLIGRVQCVVVPGVPSFFILTFREIAKTIASSEGRRDSLGSAITSSTIVRGARRKSVTMADEILDSEQEGRAFTIRVRGSDVEDANEEGGQDLTARGTVHHGEDAATEIGDYAASSAGALLEDGLRTPGVPLPMHGTGNSRSLSSLLGASVSQVAASNEAGDMMLDDAALLHSPPSIASRTHRSDRSDSMDPRSPGEAFATASKSPHGAATGSIVSNVSFSVQIQRALSQARGVVEPEVQRVRLVLYGLIVAFLALAALGDVWTGVAIRKAIDISTGMLYAGSRIDSLVLGFQSATLLATMNGGFDGHQVGVDFDATVATLLRSAEGLTEAIAVTESLGAVGGPAAVQWEKDTLIHYNDVNSGMDTVDSLAVVLDVAASHLHRIAASPRNVTATSPTFAMIHSVDATLLPALREALDRRHGAMVHGNDESNRDFLIAAPTLFSLLVLVTGVTLGFAVWQLALRTEDALSAFLFVSRRRAHAQRDMVTDTLQKLLREAEESDDLDGDSDGELNGEDGGGDDDGDANSVDCANDKVGSILRKGRRASAAGSEKLGTKTVAIVHEDDEDDAMNNNDEGGKDKDKDRASVVRNLRASSVVQDRTQRTSMRSRSAFNASCAKLFLPVLAMAIFLGAVYVWTTVALGEALRLAHRVYTTKAAAGRLMGFAHDITFGTMSPNVTERSEFMVESVHAREQLLHYTEVAIFGGTVAVTGHADVTIPALPNDNSLVYRVLVEDACIASDLVSKDDGRYCREYEDGLLTSGVAPTVTELVAIGSRLYVAQNNRALYVNSTDPLPPLLDHIADDVRTFLHVFDPLVYRAFTVASNFLDMEINTRPVGTQESMRIFVWSYTVVISLLILFVFVPRTQHLADSLRAAQGLLVMLPQDLVQSSQNVRSKVRDIITDMQLRSRRTQ